MTGTSEAPPCSLIICTRDRPRLLQETIDSILEGADVPAELIVIDQSANEHPELARLVSKAGCEIRYVHLPPAGLSGARNRGIAAARHEILVFCDDDMLSSPLWLGALVRVLAEAGPRTVVTGLVLPAEAERRGGFVPSMALGEVRREYEGRIDKDVLAGGNMALFRSAIDDVGLFDERLGAGGRYPSADDNDLGLRLLDAGYRIVFVPEAVLYHRAWRPSREYPLVRWRYGLGKGGFYAKHASGGDSYMLGRARRDLSRRLLRVPAYVWRRPVYALGEAAYAVGVIVGAVRWVALEREKRG